MKNILFFICLFSLVNFGFSQPIAAWDFSGESSPVSSSADVWNSNLDGSNLVTRGSGASASTGGNSFRTTGFQNNGIAITNTDYFEHTLSAAPGFKLSLSSINGNFAGTTSFSASPGVSMQFAYSLDGTNFTLIGSPFIKIGNGAMTNPVDLSGISNLQNVPEDVTVTIRFYASGQTTTGGWGYNSPSANTYGISFNGSLICSTQLTYFADTDGDSYGDPNSSIQACSLPTGYVLDNTDCNDKNASINPNTIWYADADGDGFGSPSSTKTSCTQPSGYVDNSSDCDDASNLINPNTAWYEDADGDGFGNSSIMKKSCTKPDNYVSNTTDCDDTNDQIYPGATEICDSKDNNCDGKVDEGFDLKTYYTDADGDGFGDEATSVEACEQPQNTITIGGDCDDKNNLINPNAQDISGNSIDENCDGVDGNVGIQELSEIKLYVSPNPNEGSFLIQLNQIVNNAEINLTDLNGKVIQVHRFHGDSVQINENNLEKGLYLVRVSFNGNKLVQRIIIQ